MPARSAGIVLLGGALLLGACGGGSESPTPEDGVREAALRLERTHDRKVLCNRLVTNRLIEDVYRDRTTCLKAPRGDDVKDPGTPRVSSVAVHGRRATARVAVAGGQGDGLRGAMAFKRERGAWRLDRYGEDYLRSVLAVSIRIVKEGLITAPPMRACMTRQARTMSERLVRRVVYESLRGDSRVRKTLIGIAKRCPRALASAFTDVVSKALAKSKRVGPAYKRCIRRQMLFFLDLTQLSEYALAGNRSFIGDAALGGLFKGIRNNCKQARRG